MEGGVVLTIDPRWVWLRSVWRFEIQFVIVPLDKVLNVEKMLGIIHMLRQQKDWVKKYQFLLTFSTVFTSCGHIVRDFESEAKTRSNFQFR